MSEEFEIFFSVFAYKNNLFPPEEKCPKKKIEELTEEERAHVMKAGLMMEGMERHTLRKAITAGDTA
jgi:hypothetical protein